MAKSKKLNEEEGNDLGRAVVNEGNERYPGGLPFLTERPSESNHLNLLIYGESGSGKTHLAGTAADCVDTSPPLYIDLESGTRTLHGKDIDVVRPRAWREVQQIYEFLLHENTKYRSVVMDSVTEIQKRQSMGVILGEITEDPEDGYIDLGKTPLATRGDWSRTGEQTRKVIRAFRDLAYLTDKDRRIHVIFLALEKYNEKEKLFSPQLPGVLGKECGALLDIITRLSRQNKVISEEGAENKEVLMRFLLTDDHVNEEGVRFMAKNRGSRLPKGIWEPNIDSILKFWRVESGS